MSATTATNKAQLFITAHALAKSNREAFVDYRAAFRWALAQAWAMSRKQLTKRQRRMVSEAEQCLQSQKVCAPRTLCQAHSGIEACKKYAGLVADLDSTLAAKLTSRAAELTKEWAQADEEAKRFEAAFFGPRYRARQQARFDRQYRIDRLHTVNNPYV